MKPLSKAQRAFLRDLVETPGERLGTAQCNHVIRASLCKRGVIQHCKADGEPNDDGDHIQLTTNGRKVVRAIAMGGAL